MSRAAARSTRARAPPRVGETIKSARFTADRLYLVTFVQTDPLFTINLDDPANPYVMGELKIPGFSAYLHPLNDTHVIGVGRDADDETGIERGLQFSLFDVLPPPCLGVSFARAGGRRRRRR